jgi:hypothetical protein
MEGASMTDPYESPCCKAQLVYSINVDAYVCRACQKQHDFIAEEDGTVLFDNRYAIEHKPERVEFKTPPKDPQ